MREITGFYKVFIKILAIFTSILHLYTASFGVFPLRVMRSVHLMLLLPMCFILFPANKKSPTDKPSLFDILLIFFSTIVGLYIMFNYEYLQIRWVLASPVFPIQVILGIINILLILEATRRAVTPAMTIVACIGLLYLYFGQLFSGILYHSGYSISRIAELMYLADDNGIYGLFTGISSTYVIIFVIFGSFVLEAGVGNAFNDLAAAFAGNTVGGPAKVAVISSGLFGMMSGIGVANVYATGSFTIPLMKKLGYRPQFAAAVEAAASTGGQFMPPIMGAAAFLMAEMIGVPYITIAVSAFIGGALYFFSIGIGVHWESVKQGLKGMPKENIPELKSAIKKIYMFFPVVVIVFYLVKGYSPLMAGVAGIAATIPMSYLSKDTFMGLKKILNALEKGAINTTMIAVACACAGMVVSAVINSGLGISFGSIVMNITKGMLLPALFFAMILCIILGTGLPCTAAYIISATLAAPILVKMGVPLLASHLFCLYFGVIASLTPPVAIGAYAAASIAKSDPIKTGFEAVKLSMSAFIIPYVFVYDKHLLMQGHWVNIVISTISTIIGIFLLISGTKGFVFFQKYRLFQRVIFVISAFLILFSNQWVKIFFLLIFFAFVLSLYFNKKRKRIFVSKEKVLASNEIKTKI